MKKLFPWLLTAAIFLNVMFWHTYLTKRVGFKFDLTNDLKQAAPAVGAMEDWAPQWDPDIFTKVLIENLAQRRADVAIIGDSMVGQVVIPFQELYPATASLTVGFVAAGSTEIEDWYYMIRDIILANLHRPKMILLFLKFHDTWVGPKINFGIKGLAQRWFPTVAASRRIPFYQNRFFARWQVGRAIKLACSKLSSRYPRASDIEDQIGSVFALRNLNRELFKFQKNLVISPKEMREYSVLYATSYLRKIIEVTRKNGIQLIAVMYRESCHAKNNCYLERQVESNEILNRYLQQVRAQVAAEGAIYVDITSDTRLGEKNYIDRIHLDREGCITLSQILMQIISTHLKK